MSVGVNCVAEGGVGGGGEEFKVLLYNIDETNEKCCKLRHLK